MPNFGIVELDHVSCTVRDIARARRFYEAALGAIGMKVNMEVRGAFGMGSRSQLIFWLVEDDKASGRAHYALRVKQREHVKAFYAAALAAGGKDHGKPGLRPNYGKNYYAAFVKDPDGNNIEAVCYAAPTSRAPAAKRSTASKSPAATNAKRRAGSKASAPAKRGAKSR